MKKALRTVDSDEAKAALMQGVPRELTEAQQARISLLEGIKGQGTVPDDVLQKQIDGIKYAPSPEAVALANKLPAGAQLTKKDIANLALGPGKTLEKDAADLPDAVHAALKELPFEYNPQARRPLQEHRAYLTDAQNAAVDSLGGLNETRSYQLKTMVPEMLAQSLKRAIKNANDTGVPGVSSAAQTINDINRQQHVLLSLTGESPRLIQKIINGKENLSSQLNQGLMDQAMVHGLMSGHPAAIAVGAGAHFLPKAIRSARTAVTDVRADLADAGGVTNFITKAVSRGRTIPDAVKDAIAAGAPRGAVTAALNFMRSGLQ